MVVRLILLFVMLGGGMARAETVTLALSGGSAGTIPELLKFLAWAWKGETGVAASGQA